MATRLRKTRKFRGSRNHGWGQVGQHRASGYKGGLGQSGMSISEATQAPRFHHQWWPDQIRIETGFSADTVTLLKAKGHEVKVSFAMGAVESVFVREDF